MKKNEFKWTAAGMDRWLAEHVMKWKLVRSRWPRQNQFSFDDHNVIAARNGNSKNRFNPMENMHDAFEVLDVLVKSRKVNVEMSYWPNFGRRKYSVGGCAGATLQEAICRFAHITYLDNP